MTGRGGTDDKPLDPELERVRRKIVRFFAISIGATLLAVMGVLVAVVYKLNAISHHRPSAGYGISGEAASAATTIPLATGTKVISQSLSGDRLSLDTIRADGSRQIIIYDIGKGHIVAQFDLGRGH